MPLQFYKPNTANTGTACGVSFNSKDGAIYISFIKQTKPKTNDSPGSFKGGKQLVTKFSVGETGALIDTIEKGRPFDGYHAIPGSTQNTKISFKPYFVGEDKKTLKGIGLSVIKSDKEDSTFKENYSVGFSLGEAVALREYLRFALGHIYAAIYSKDKKAYEDSQNREEREKPQSEKKKATEKAADKPAEKKAKPPEDDPFADEPESAFANSTEVEGTDEATPETAPKAENKTQKEEKSEESPTNTDNTQTEDDDIF